MIQACHLHSISCACALAHTPTTKPSTVIGAYGVDAARIPPNLAKQRQAISKFKKSWVVLQA